jgi:hypothetical protein
MIRRNFLLKMLLGGLIAVVKKVPTLPILNQILPIAPIPKLEPIFLFITPDGNDSWSGKQKTPTANHNDGPLASVEGAKAVIRELRLSASRSQKPSLNRPIKVVLSDGIYFLTKPILFEPEDSGTKDSPVSYQSDIQGAATISGGKIITGWQSEIVNNIEMWTVNLPGSSESWHFQHLWVNGQRRERSRYPSQGYLQVKAVQNTKGQPRSQGHYSFQYTVGDLPTNISLQGGEVVIMNRWTESRLPITRVDHHQNTIYFSKKSVFKLAARDLFYIENVFDCLDTPGEWYLDRDRSKLYYIPLAEENLDTAQVIVPTLAYLMTFRGQAIENQMIKYLSFDKLIFAHTNWHLPQTISGYIQGARGVSGAITASGIGNCQWRDCTFKHLGNYAIDLGGGCQDNQIVNCSMFDLGAGGIKIGEQQTNLSQISPSEVTHHNTIINNHIFEGGKFFPSAVGICVINSHDNVIADNHIHDFYYTAISVRGTWGFKKTQAYNNLIEHNYVHHIGKLSNGDGPILSDMGGVYILGRQDGTIIRHNKIHDINALRYGGWGIYLDEGSSYIVAEHNLVYRTSHGGFAQHYGRENLIRHNIFAFGGTAQIHRHRKDWKLSSENEFMSFRFEKNIVYWDQGKLIAGLKDGLKDKRNVWAVFDHNIYWQSDNREFLFCGLPWKKWQQRGNDQHSLIADPLFIAPQQDNFQLSPNSSALRLGISSSDMVQQPHINDNLDKN